MATAPLATPPNSMIRRHAKRALAASAVCMTALAVGCFPGITFQDDGAADGGGNGGGVDATTGNSGGGSDGGPSLDGGTEHPGTDGGGGGGGDGAGVRLPPDVKLVLDGVGIPTESGNAQQQHMIYTANGKRYWIFYLDSESNLVKTRTSTDFTNWVAGASLTLPAGHGGEGRNLSVAYRDFNGRDVVHVATSLHNGVARVVWDTRAVLDGATATFSAPVLVHDIDDGAEAGTSSDTSCDPDGNGVAIGADGRVYVATAWVAVPGCCKCDSNVVTSTSVDNGTSWAGGFDKKVQHFTVPGESHAHQITPLSTGNMMASWESADDQPPTDVRFATKNAGVWTPDEYYNAAFNVFPDTSTPSQQRNDWSLCRIDDSSIHVVRRRSKGVGDAGRAGTNSAFDHFVYNGGGWTYAVAPADETGIDDSGVVVLTNGKGLLAAAIAKDALSSIRYATWSPGDAKWSDWKSLSGTTSVGGRGYLSGTGCGEQAHPALIWTERGSAPYQVVGAPVATLIP